MKKQNGTTTIPVEFADIEQPSPPLPPPGSLKKPSEKGDNAAALIATLLKNDQTVVVGGISLIGDKETVVPIISIVASHNGMLRGWVLPIGHPHMELAFNYIDVANGMPPIVMADAEVHFIGTAEPALTLPDANVAELIEIVQFVLPFITKEGPPVLLDW